jgi:hypothetical protein
MDWKFCKILIGGRGTRFVPLNVKVIATKTRKGQVL